MNDPEKLGIREQSEIRRTMVRHPVGPVRLEDNHGEWRLVGRMYLDDLRHTREAAALERLTEPDPAWCDDACLGTAASFIEWAKASGLDHRIREDDPDGWEHFLVMRLRVGLGTQRTPPSRRGRAAISWMVQAPREGVAAQATGASDRSRGDWRATHTARMLVTDGKALFVDVGR